VHLARRTQGSQSQQIALIYNNIERFDANDTSNKRGPRAPKGYLQQPSPLPLQMSPPQFGHLPPQMPAIEGADIQLGKSKVTLDETEAIITAKYLQGGGEVKGTA